jgi:hypothetical protein
MYRFMDRHVLSLAPGEQALLWSVRAWTDAMLMQRCPCAALGPAFARWRVSELLPDFNMAMFLLNGEGLGRMMFGAPPCAHVHDDEAMLLALFHAASADDFHLLERMALQLVKQESIAPFIVAASQAAELLRRTPVPKQN